MHIFKCVWKIQLVYLLWPFLASWLFKSRLFRHHAERNKAFPLQFLIARFMGPTWSPPAACRPQVGPMLAPWTLLSWVISHEHQDISIQLSISLLRLISKETSKPAALALCEWNPLVTGGFPSQRASNAGGASMSLHHNALLLQYEWS